MNFKKKLVALPLAAALMAVTALPAVAQPNQGAGAAGVVSAIVQVDRSLNDLADVDLTDANVEVITVKDSLNNVLQSANILNNVDILRDSNVLTDFLNDADVDVNVEDVVAVDVLSDGTVVVYQA